MADDDDVRICGGCKKEIEEGSVVIGDKHYHPGCFVCFNCKKPIAGRFFQKDEGPVCASCNAVPCSECGKPIDGARLEAGGLLFHKDCFVCAFCKTKITTKYAKHQQKMICLGCKEKLTKEAEEQNTKARQAAMQAPPSPSIGIDRHSSDGYDSPVNSPVTRSQTMGNLQSPSPNRLSQRQGSSLLRGQQGSQGSPYGSPVISRESSPAPDNERGLAFRQAAMKYGSLRDMEIDETKKQEEVEKEQFPDGPKIISSLDKREIGQLNKKAEVHKQDLARVERDRPANKDINVVIKDGLKRLETVATANDNILKSLNETSGKLLVYSIKALLEVIPELINMYRGLFQSTKTKEFSGEAKKLIEGIYEYTSTVDDTLQADKFKMEPINATSVPVRNLTDGLIDKLQAMGGSGLGDSRSSSGGTPTTERKITGSVSQEDAKKEDEKKKKEEADKKRKEEDEKKKKDDADKKKKEEDEKKKKDEADKKKREEEAKKAPETKAASVTVSQAAGVSPSSLRNAQTGPWAGLSEKVNDIKLQFLEELESSSGSTVTSATLTNTTEDIVKLLTTVLKSLLDPSAGNQKALDGGNQIVDTVLPKFVTESTGAVGQIKDSTLREKISGAARTVFNSVESVFDYALRRSQGKTNPGDSATAFLRDLRTSVSGLIDQMSEFDDHLKSLAASKAAPSANAEDALKQMTEEEEALRKEAEDLAAEEELLNQMVASSKKKRLDDEGTSAADKAAKEEADKKAKEEAEKKAKEEAEKKAKEEADRKAKEEAEKKAKAEAEKKAKEEADRKAKEEAEKKAKEEADRKAKEEADRKAKEEEELRQFEEEERKAQEEAEKRAKAEAEKKAKEEADKKAREEEELRQFEEEEKKAKEEADKKAKEAEEKKQKEETDKKAKE